MKILVFATLLFFLFATPAHAQVVLSEVYPAPTSDEKEWIELFNTSDSVADISGWKLFEHFSSKNELITFANIQIQPHGFYIFELPTSKLNNSEEKITLENSTTTEVSAIHYTSSESQKSFSFLFQSESSIGDTLQLGTPTKNARNPLEPVATAQPTATPLPTITPLPQTQATPTVSPASIVESIQPSTAVPTAIPILTTDQTSVTPQKNQQLELYQIVSAQLKFPKKSKIEKDGLVQRIPQLSYIVQKKVSKVGVVSAIIGGSVLLFIGFLL